MQTPTCTIETFDGTVEQAEEAVIKGQRAVKETRARTIEAREAHTAAEKERWSLHRANMVDPTSFKEHDELRAANKANSKAWREHIHKSYAEDAALEELMMAQANLMHAQNKRQKRD